MEVPADLAFLGGTAMTVVMLLAIIWLRPWDLPLL